MGHGHPFPPSSCWSKTRNLHSLLLTKPPAGIWGGGRESQGSIWPPRTSPPAQASPKPPLAIPLPDALVPSWLRGRHRAGWVWSDFPLPFVLEHRDTKCLAAVCPPQGFLASSGVMGAQPCVPHGTHNIGHNSQLSATLAGAFLSKPHREPPPFPGDASSPLPRAP